MNAFQRTRRIPSILVAGLVAYALARSSHAYCVSKGDFMVAWRDSFSDLTIPVYMVSSGKSSVASTGHSPTDVARIVREVIARHNETVAVPKLRFGGVIDVEFTPGSGTPHASLDGGITILSYRCEDLNPDTQMDLCGTLSDSGVHACASVYRPPNSLPPTKASIILVPAGCDTIPTPADKWTLSGNPDLAYVLLHEIGHTLGLQHTNVTQAVCETGGNVHVGDPDGAEGVMRGAVAAKYPVYRSWRRDDLAGPLLDTRRRLALFEDPQGLLATIGAGRLGLGSYPGIVPDATLVDLDADWPLGLGHWTAGQVDQWRMFQPRGVACGDGIVQAGESCDDANDIAGDGCDACVLEPEDDSDTDDGGKGNDEVGDYGGAEDSGQEGCECRASRTRAPAGVLTLLGLLAIRRRRTP